MEDRETARMGKYGESKTTRIMVAIVPHVTSGLGLRKFQADGFFVDTSVRIVTARSWMFEADDTYAYFRGLTFSYCVYCTTVAYTDLDTVSLLLNGA